MTYVLHLPDHLRERIIAKLEWKSYFRLQQTCHDMVDFYKINRKVIVCLPHSFRLQIISNTNGLPEYYVSLRKPADLESLYGVRFNQTTFQAGFLISLAVRGSFIGSVDQRFLSECCKILKKYRITSRYLDTYNLKECPSEEYEEMLRIMKPICLNLDSRGSNRFEALLNVKNMEKVMFTANISDIQDLTVIQKFLAKFRQLDIILDAGNSPEPNFGVVKIILQYLHSVPPTNLRSFTFSEPYDYDTRLLPQPEEFIELFKDSNPVHLKTFDHAPRDMHRYFFTCRLGENRHCELKIGLQRIDIQFKAVDQRK